MDRDTTSHKGAHRAIAEGMAARRIDILVGTQILGHSLGIVRVKSQ